MPVRFESVIGHLRAKGKLEDAGGASFVCSTEANVAWSGNVDWFLAEVLQLYRQRATHRAAQIAASEVEAGCDAADVATRHADAMREIAATEQSSSWQSPNAEACSEWLGGLDRSDAERNVIRNCHATLHGMTGGFPRGQISVVALPARVRQDVRTPAAGLSRRRLSRHVGLLVPDRVGRESGPAASRHAALWRRRPQVQHAALLGGRQAQVLSDGEAVRVVGRALFGVVSPANDGGADRARRLPTGASLTVARPTSWSSTT